MQPIAAAEDCAYHTAAALAGGTDSADVIAAAVADACFSEIEGWTNWDVKNDPSTPREQSVREVVIAKLGLKYCATGPLHGAVMPARCCEPPRTGP